MTRTGPGQESRAKRDPFVDTVFDKITRESNIENVRNAKFFAVGNRTFREQTMTQTQTKMREMLQGILFRFRDLLYPLHEGETFLGTHEDPDQLYNDMLKALDYEMDIVRRKESVSMNGDYSANRDSGVVGEAV